MSPACLIKMNSQSGPALVGTCARCQDSNAPLAKPHPEQETCNIQKRNTFKIAIFRAKWQRFGTDSQPEPLLRDASYDRQDNEKNEEQCNGVAVYLRSWIPR